MSYFLWTAALNDMTCNRLGIHDEEKSDLFSPRYDWIFQRRTPASVNDGYGFFSSWPMSKGMGGDPTLQMYIFGQDNNDRCQFEPYTGLYGGYFRPYFVNGLCVDGASTPIQSAVVELFLTATDVKVSTVQSNGSGVYSAWSPFIGQNHYAVANYGPNTLVGTTVDTLQPVLAPW